MSAHRLRPRLAKLHRWLSLSMMALWLLQAITGMICVFHWELDDASLVAADRPTDLVAIARRLALLAGDTGGWIIGLSGVLLLSNLALGLSIAWARRGQWRRTLDPRGGRNTAARLFGWHRALGLWLVVPALLLASTGILRVFSDGFEGLIGGGVPAAPTVAPDGRRIDLPTGVHAALVRQPQARLAAVIFPDAHNATWQIGLVEPGEWSRAYDKSRVFVDGRSGRVIGEYDAPRASLSHRIAV